MPVNTHSQAKEPARPGLRSLARLFCLIGLLLLAAEARAQSVYEKQPPVTDKELVSFMELLPHFRAWAASVKEEPRPSVNKEGTADFIYSRKAADWVKQRGWEPVRFFCVMGRAAAALFLVEEGSDANAKRPPDMPAVSQAELDMVRRHLAELLKAGNDAPPINR